MHVSTAVESKMCYSLGTSVGNKTEWSKRCAIFVVYIADLANIFANSFLLL